MFKCDQCTYKSKYNSYLKRHKLSVHDIGLKESSPGQILASLKCRTHRSERKNKYKNTYISRAYRLNNKSHIKKHYKCKI